MYDPQQYNADHIVPQGHNRRIFLPPVMKNVYLWMTLALAITGLTAMAVATQPQMVYSIASNSRLLGDFCTAELVSCGSFPRGSCRFPSPQRVVSAICFRRAA